MRRRSSDTTWSLLVLFSIHIVLCVGQRSGKPAKPGDYPYLLTVLNHGRGICAATLFTTTLAITACHCLLKDASGVFKAPHDLLETGRMELDSGNEGQHPTGQPRFVKVIKVHPKCESTQRSMVYDFGLIEVTEPFELKNGYTEILNFLEPADDKPKDCYGLEFQTVERDGKPWDISTMQIRKLAVTNDEICAGLFKYYHRKLEFRPDLQFCAGSQDEDADKTFFCGLPDYGSPVVCHHQGNPKEGRNFLGVLSGRNHHYCKSRNNPEKEVPEVYARASISFEWIEKEYPDVRKPTTIATTMTIPSTTVSTTMMTTASITTSVKPTTSVSTTTLSTTTGSTVSTVSTVSTPKPSPTPNTSTTLQPKPFPPFVPDYDPDMPSTIVPGCWIDDGGPHSFDVYPFRYSTLPFLIVSILS